MSPADQERYSRQILFAELGEEGQRRLLASRCALVGCGALGSFHAAALARAGVGEIRIIDRDYVEEGNLQRQWLFDERDAAEALPKAVAAARRLAAVNSGVKVTPLVSDLDADNIAELLGGVDVILDGTDNFEARYLINEYAVEQGVPWIYGAAVGSYGLTMPILPGESACLACLFPEPPSGAQPTCDTAGILNSASAAIAAWQVADAVKLLAGRRDAVQPRLLTLDVWQGEPRVISTAKPNPECVVCGQRRFERLASAGRRGSAVLCGRNAVQVRGASAVDLVRLRTALEPLGQVTANEYALRLVKPPYEMTVFSDGRAIIKGVQEVAQARSLYSRWVGA